MSYHITGWTLDPAERRALLQLFPPVYPDAIADHVTLKVGQPANAKPPENKIGEIVGIADDGEGVQALVVSIDGTTDRPGGGTYHITWSLDKSLGRTAKQSNDVLAAQGWTPLSTPKPVTLTGARLR